MKRWVAGLAFGAVAGAAQASTIYTSNFSQGQTLPYTDSNGANYELGYDGGGLAGITTSGFAFVYASAADSMGMGASSKWGAIIMDSAVTADPYDTQDNGAFLGVDGDYDAYPVDIAVTTVAGQSYTVTFDWAATQEAGFPGGTTDSFQVALGDSAAQSTTVVSAPEQGFSGWMQDTMTFTADTTGTDELSFLAAGSPAVPPFALLDNINLSTSGVTPEPNSLVLLGTGLMGLGGLLRMRMKRSSKAAV